MIDVRWKGFTQILEFVMAVSEVAPPTGPRVAALMETETMAAWACAYAPWPEFDLGELYVVLANLLRDEPVARTRMMRTLERGFRQALERPDQLRENFGRCSRIDFNAAEQKAKAFLPADVELDAQVHFTVDAFNGGFFHGQDVFFSLLDIHDSFFGVDAFAHEFHHIGIRTLAGQRGREHALGGQQQALSSRLAEYLVSEGLANYYCSPRLVGIPPVKDAVDDPLAEKCSRYCSQFRELFAIACAILDSRPNSDGSVDTSDEELFRKLVFDPDGVLPPGHYLSARLVAQLDDSPRISRGEILQLCIEPERFFSLYNRDPIANDLVFPVERSSPP